jgi:hypothetical protein
VKKIILSILALALIVAVIPAPTSAQNAYIMRIQYDASQNPIYVGYALPGTAEAAAGWRIQKITYDANNNPTDISYPSGDENFTFKWSLRVGYTYSAPSPK